MRIAVLFGGENEERDVSVASAAQIVPVLRSLGHDVLAVDTAFGALDSADESRALIGTVDQGPPSREALARVTQSASSLRIPSDVRHSDLVFLALHGGSGEDGRLQALLELAGVPFTGSGPLASGLAMDKDVSKTLLKAAGLVTPDWLIAPVTAAEVSETLGFPVVVKPTAQGSTVGLTIVRYEDELSEAIDKARAYGTVMVEQFIAGRELAVGVLDGQPLAVGEIYIPEDGAFSYEDKYQEGAVREQFPADLPDEIATAAQTAAVDAHNVHRLDDFSRSDFRLDANGKLWIIETNSLPGMTATSLLPQSAAAAGITYAQLCDRIVELALERSASA